VHYTGERATFTFDHNDLDHYGEDIRESKKVRELLNKISDPKLEAAKQAVHINPENKEDFTAAINFLAESVEPLKKQSQRVLATVTTESNPPGNHENFE
jgi:hypothetical protein